MAVTCVLFLMLLISSANVTFFSGDLRTGIGIDGSSSSSGLNVSSSFSDLCVLRIICFLTEEEHAFLLPPLQPLLVFLKVTRAFLSGLMEFVN